MNTPIILSLLLFIIILLIAVIYLLLSKNFKHKVNEKKYHEFINQMPYAVFKYDNQGKITYMNPKTRGLIATHSSEKKRQTVNLFTNPHLQKAGVSTIFFEALKQKCSTIQEVSYTTAQNKIIYTRLHINPLRNDEGEIDGAIAMVEDFTQQKQTRSSLNETEIKLKKIMENVPVGILLIEAETRTIIEVNPLVEQLVGYKAHELEGKKCKNLFCPFEKEQCPVMENKKAIVNKEFIITDAKGQKIPILKNVVPININNKNYLLETLVNISEQKLSQIEMKVAKQEAEEASASKSLFLANMSHEIRTPMNGILGMIQLLSKTNLNTRQVNYVNMIRTSADSLMTIINDILDISKIEAGKITIEEFVFDVRKHLNSIFETIKYRAETKNIDFKLEISPKVPPLIKSDAVRIRQVLINLLGNAVKFTEKGQIILKVQVTTQDTDYLILQFDVSDTGIGIPKENLQNIFEIFTQADSTYTRKYGGTGLGLAISKKMVEMLNGKITVESEINKGTTFSFTVKTKKAVMDEKLEEIPPPEKISNQDTLRMLKAFEGPLNILIAEDKFINQEYLQGILHAYKHHTKVVENGKQVLEAIKKSKFDCILMDVYMPIMDGIQATKLIRKKEQEKSEKKHIPIIALTASALKGDKEKMLNAGMDYYISKPVDEHILINTLLKIKQGKPRKTVKFSPKKEKSNSLIEQRTFDQKFSKIKIPIFRRIVTNFIENYNESLNELESAIENSKFDDIKVKAHSLKGEIMMFCAPDVSNLALEIEKAAKEMDSKKIQYYFNKLEKKLMRLHTELEKKLNQKQIS